jgi:hypothetical protein
MLHVRARSLRTALLTTALTTAVAVPAAAAPSVPATSTINAKQVKKADDGSDFRYHIRAGGRRGAEARGKVEWGRRKVRHVGWLFNNGRRHTRSTVAFRLISEDDFFRPRRFRTKDKAHTKFRERGRVNVIRIRVCHENRRGRFCETERFFRRDRRDWDDDRRAIKKGRRTSSFVRGKHPAKSGISVTSKARRSMRAGRSSKIHKLDPRRKVVVKRRTIVEKRRTVIDRLPR